MLKAFIGFALVVGDVILVRAAMDTAHSRQAAHGSALGVYVLATVLSLALWAWVLRRPAKPAQRTGYPYGGSR